MENTSVKETENVQRDEKIISKKPLFSDNFNKKLRNLWQDDRRFSERLLTSGAAVLAFVFTFIMFGPFELYIANMSYLVFGIKQLLPPIIIAGIIILAVFTVLFALLRGKIFNAVVSIVIGITIAGYIQGNYINIDHGTLDGTGIVWQDFKWQMLVNLFVWAAIILVPVIFCYFSRDIWKSFVRIVSLVLVAMQVFGAVYLVIKSAYQINSNISDDGYFECSEQFKVSKNKNTIVFLLDRMDKKYMDELLKRDPSLCEKLSGFTYYKNFTGSYSRTFPSVAYLLSGVKYDYDIPSAEYMKKAMSESNFFGALQAAGYESRLYTDTQYVTGSVESFNGTVKNAKSTEGKAKPIKILSAMLNLSAYRYSPEAMKPYFHIYTDNIAQKYIFGNEDGSIYTVDDAEFYAAFRKKGITTEDNAGSFVFYHLQGAHDPFTMNEKGEAVTLDYLNYEESMYKQIRGDFKMILSYIKQLKAAGVYDNTTIIITADHGRTGTAPSLEEATGENYGERVLTLLIKEAGADTKQPLKTSMKQVCQANLHKTFLRSMGVNYEDDGVRAIEDIGEDEEITRYFYMSGSNSLKASRDVNLITYEIKGDANDFSNWKRVKTEKMKFPFYD